MQEIGITIPSFDYRIACMVLTSDACLEGDTVLQSKCSRCRLHLAAF